MKLSSSTTTPVLLNDIKIMTPSEAKDLLFRNIYYNEYKVPRILDSLNEKDVTESAFLSEGIGGLDEGFLRTLVNDSDWQSLHLDFMNDVEKFLFLHHSGRIPFVSDFWKTLEFAKDYSGIPEKFLTRHFQWWMPFDESLSTGLDLSRSPFEDSDTFKKSKRYFWKNFREGFRNFYLEKAFNKKVIDEEYPDFFRKINNLNLPENLKLSKSNFLERKERFYDFTENEMFNFMHYLNLVKKNDIRLFQYGRMKEYLDDLLDPEQPWYRFLHLRQKMQTVLPYFLGRYNAQQRLPFFNPDIIKGISLHPELNYWEADISDYLDLNYWDGQIHFDLLLNSGLSSEQYMPAQSFGFFPYYDIYPFFSFCYFYWYMPFWLSKDFFFFFFDTRYSLQVYSYFFGFMLFSFFSFFFL